MLHQPAPFPYVGSYALYEDDGDGGRLALVRILARRAAAGGGEAHAMIAFPLRDGAAGNRMVPERLLFDAAALSGEELREYHDLDRELRRHLEARAGAGGADGARPPRLSTRKRAALARRDSLRLRMIHAPIAERLLRELRRRQAAANWRAA